MGKIRKVLLVDDDEITCFLNKSVLEELQVAEQIEYVHNGAEALNYIKENHTGEVTDTYSKDLLFLDLNMPVMDGIEFLEEFEKLNEIDKTRFTIVILTSSAHSKDASNVALHNKLVHSYVLKPLHQAMLKKIVDDIQ
ncbi:response regulator [Cesiribacter sp. SM1]|uniref:response regulator n=1 Tax=Cesiribacter sp. SM1 TaxID=2861196 RepID=UPI001CD1D4E6|nr:response regulator [Cesiribacter sp. SM1]